MLVKLILLYIAMVIMLLLTWQDIIEAVFVLVRGNFSSLPFCPLSKRDLLKQGVFLYGNYACLNMARHIWSLICYFDISFINYFIIWQD